MTKEAIIKEIRKHSREEQQKIFEALLEPTEEDYELTDAEKALVDRRWKEMQEHPEHTMTLKELKKSVQQLTKRLDAST